jgi:hypothetical protein
MGGDTHTSPAGEKYFSNTLLLQLLPFGCEAEKGKGKFKNIKIVQVAF